MPTAAAIAASEALFGQGDLAALDADDAASGARGAADTPTCAAGRTVAQALVDTGLVTSLGEARRAIAQGGVSLNSVKVRRRRGRRSTRRAAGRRGRAAPRQEDARRRVRRALT